MLQSTLDFLDHYRQLLAEMVPGTGTWVLAEQEFRVWKEASSPSQLLWMHGIRKRDPSGNIQLGVFTDLVQRGIVGSGKTMLV